MPSPCVYKIMMTLPLKTCVTQSLNRDTTSLLVHLGSDIISTFLQFSHLENPYQSVIASNTIQLILISQWGATNRYMTFRITNKKYNHKPCNTIITLSKYVYFYVSIACVYGEIRIPRNSVLSRSSLVTIFFFLKVSISLFYVKC